MKIRANADSGPVPLSLLSFGRYYGAICSLAVVIVVGLLLLGLFLDRDLRPIFLGPLAGGMVVGFFLWLRDRRRFSDARLTASAQSVSDTHSKPGDLPRRDTWTPEPKHLVPFGPYGGGQWTAHPVGLVIVIGFVLMGLFSRTPVGFLVFFSLLGGVLVGLFLWFYHR